MKVSDFQSKSVLVNNDLFPILDSETSIISDKNKKISSLGIFNYVKNYFKYIFESLVISAGSKNNIKGSSILSFGNSVLNSSLMNACEIFNSDNVDYLPASNNYKYHATILDNKMKGAPEESFIISSPANIQSEFSVSYHPCIFKINISAFLVLIDTMDMGIEKSTFDCSGYIDLDNRTFIISEMKNMISLKEQERLIPFFSKVNIFPTFNSSETFTLNFRIPNLSDISMNWFNTGAEVFKDYKIYSSFVIRTQELYGISINKKGKDLI